MYKLSKLVLLLALLGVLTFTILRYRNIEIFNNIEFQQVPPDPRYAWLEPKLKNIEQDNRLDYVEWPPKIDTQCHDKACDYARRQHILTPDQFKRYSIGVTLGPEGYVKKGYLKGWPISENSPASWINPDVLIDPLKVTF
jgi:hypothetical protein